MRSNERQLGEPSASLAQRTGVTAISGGLSSSETTEPTCNFLRISTEPNHLLPRIDITPKEDHDVDEEEIKEAEIALAKAYIEDGPGTIRKLVKLAALIAFVDYLIMVPSQIYGLVFTTTGTWMLLVETDFQDRFDIAARARNESPIGFKPPLDPHEKKYLARQSVMSNIALVWITIEFVLQILALLLFPSGEMINANIIANLSV